MLVRRRVRWRHTTDYFTPNGGVSLCNMLTEVGENKLWKGKYSATMW